MCVCVCVKQVAREGLLLSSQTQTCMGTFHSEGYSAGLNRSAGSSPQEQESHYPRRSETGLCVCVCVSVYLCVCVLACVRTIMSYSIPHLKV